MSDWIDLPGFPKTYSSSCAPWGSVARLVRGVPEKKNGRPVLLSAAKGFLQRIEQEIVAGYRSTKDVAALVHGVLDAHARHLDVAEWCRARDGEIDLSLRVYASRGSARLHVALAGPVGQFADTPLPEHAPAPKAPRGKKQAPKALAGPEEGEAPGGKKAPVEAEAPGGKEAPVEAETSRGRKAPAPMEAEAPARVAPPAKVLVQRIAEGARASYGDAIAFDRDGRLHVTLRLAGSGAYAYGGVEPSGAVTVTALPTREALRADDTGAMTGGMMPALHATERGLVRIEHYDHASGMKERVGFAGAWHATRGFRADAIFVLGVRGEWFLRCIVHGGRASLLGAHLATGKRTKITLPVLAGVRGAALDRGLGGQAPDADVLRLVCGPEEHRFPLRAGKALEVDAGAATVVQHGLAGAVQPLTDGAGAWVVAEEREGRGALRWVRADGLSAELFALPASFTAPGYAPWGSPAAQAIHGDGQARSWLVPFDFGADGAPRCTGAVVVTREGQVLASAYVDADGALRCGEASFPLGEGELVCGYAGAPPVMGRPSGELAVLVAKQAGMEVLWAPPAV